VGEGTIIQLQTIKRRQKQTEGHTPFHRYGGDADPWRRADYYEQPFKFNNSRSVLKGRRYALRSNLERWRCHGRIKEEGKGRDKSECKGNRGISPESKRGQDLTPPLYKRSLANRPGKLRVNVKRKKPRGRGRDIW